MLLRAAIDIYCRNAILNGKNMRRNYEQAAIKN